MESFNLIKFGISDDFSHVFGNDMITNVISLNFNELLVSTTNDIFIIDYKNKIIKIKYQLKFTACTVIPNADFLIGASTKKGDLQIYQINQEGDSISGNPPPLLKKFVTKQPNIFHILYSPISQSIITFGSDIRVFNFQYKINKTPKSKITITITNRSTFSYNFDPKNLFQPQFDENNELILLPTSKGICTFNLDGKKVNQCTNKITTENTIFASSPSIISPKLASDVDKKKQSNVSRKILTYDSDEGMILWGDKSQVIQKYDTVRSSVLAIIFIDSENSICVNNCNILFYVNIKTGKTFYYMNLNKNPNRLFLIRLYNEPILCACFGSTLRALNLIIPWRVWKLDIEKTTLLARCNKYMTAARILIESENSFVKLFSPRDKNQINFQIPSFISHPINYYYDRGTLENYTYDIENQIYNIDVIKITNHINFVRDTLFVICQNGSIFSFDTNINESQKEVKTNCKNPSFMTICRVQSHQDNDDNSYKWCYAVCSEKSELFIIDYFTFEELFQCTVTNDELIQFFYHFESNLFVFIYPQKTVLFDHENGKIVDSIEINGNKVTSLFSNNILYGYESGHIQRVTITNRKLVICNDIKIEKNNRQKMNRKTAKKEDKSLLMMKPHSCPVTAFSFSPKIWISSGLDGNVVAYNYNFDIICKISLPLPLRSCLIMNGRRDIIVATATEIMEIKNDFLFYDVCKTKKKNSEYIEKLEIQCEGQNTNGQNINGQNINGQNNGQFNNDLDDDDVEETVDPEVKEIDNFDKLKDEFFCVRKKNVSGQKPLEQRLEDTSTAESESVEGCDMKEIRKFRRSQLQKKNANEVISISTSSEKPAKNAFNNKNSVDGDKSKKQPGDGKSVNQTSKGSDAVKKSSKSDKNEAEKDSKSDKIKPADSDKEASKKDTDVEKDKKDEAKELENLHDSQNGSESSSVDNKSDNDSLSSSSFSSSASTASEDKKQREKSDSDQSPIGLGQLESQKDGYNDGKSEDGADGKSDNQTATNEIGSHHSSGDSSEISHEKSEDDLTSCNRKSDTENGGESFSGQVCNNGEDSANFDEKSDTNTASSLVADESARSQSDNNGVGNSEDSPDAAGVCDLSETSGDGGCGDVSDSNGGCIEKVENEKEECDDKKTVQTDDDSESLEHDAKSDTNDEEGASSNDVTESETDVESTAVKTADSDSEINGKIDSKSENNEFTSASENIEPSSVTSPIESVYDPTENIQNDTKAASIDVSEANPDCSIAQQEPPQFDDEAATSINDVRFTSDDERCNSARPKSDADNRPNSARSPTPPPIRKPPTATSQHNSDADTDSTFDFTTDRANRHRSRTPSPRRTKRRQTSRGFPPNVVIDKEAVLALYGRGRVEFLPFVEQIQREFLISRYGLECGAPNRITLTCVQNLTKSLSKKNVVVENNRQNLTSFDHAGIDNRLTPLKTPPHRRLLPPIGINKTLMSPTAYVYNYETDTETFFNRLEMNNGVKTPRRAHACSVVMRPLILIQPPCSPIVRPNVPSKRNHSFRPRRESVSCKTIGSPRRKLGRGSP